MAKTGYALCMVEQGTHYFLSRPRRFGKSPFLDTLKELFEGGRDLFERLDACDRWDWSVRRPVVRLDLSGVNAKDPGDLNADVLEQLDAQETDAGVEPRHARARGRFRHLLRALHRQTGQPVAVLIDEYDKPILDALRGGGGRARQPRLPARPVLNGQVRRRPHPLLLPDGSQQVLQVSLF